MHLKCYILVGQFILYLFHRYGAVNAMSGMNVRRARFFDFPFAAAIMRMQNDELKNPYLVCTGSLITERHVVTTAKCLDNEVADRMKVIIGSNNINNGRRYAVSWWMVYDEWALYKNLYIEYEENDIGIIRLYKLVSHEIKPAVMSLAPEINNNTINVRIAGWSSLSYVYQELMLGTVELNAVQGPECGRTCVDVRDNLLNDNRFLCTNAETFVFITDTDRGGPVVNDNKLVAMIVGAANFGKVIFMNFEKYMDFFDEVMTRE